MNVLIENDDNGVGTGALARGFAQLGHDPALWVPSKMPTHEAFARQKPDLFIGPTSALTPALLRNQGKCRLALWQDNLTFLKELPPGAFLFATDNNEDDLPVIRWPFLQLDQKTLYCEDLATDVLFLDEYRTGYDAFFMPLFESSDYVARAYSEKPWPVPYYAGSLNPQERAQALASTLIHPMSADEARDIRKVYEVLRVGVVPAVAGNEDLISYGSTPEGYVSLVKELVYDKEAHREAVESLTDLFLPNTPIDAAEAFMRAMLTC